MSLILPRRVVLVVGNGLTLDLLQCSPGAIGHWSSQNPLRWNIYHPSDPSRYLIDTHRALGPTYRALRGANPEASDFQLLDQLLTYGQRDGVPDYASAVARELRNYLALSFSYLQWELLDRAIGDRYSEAVWSQWLRRHARELRMVISYNYDLVVERMLSAAGIRFFRIGLEREESAVPLLKPHSSIDFGPDGLAGAVIINSDVPQRLLTRSEMLQHRREWNIILPGEPSFHADLQWVQPGLERFHGQADELTHIILVGLSYWKADRPELDNLLAAVSPDTRIVLANPRPPQDWIDQLSKRHGRVELWLDGPRDLD